MDTPAKKLRGFAAMTPEKRREAASKGGLSVDPKNRAFSKNRKLAVKAGSKGGSAVAPEDRAYARWPEVARAAGRKGGAARSRIMQSLDA